jgi:5'/3'-nucleotidase
MRILVCNDDGISSPGLDLLARAALALEAEVWIVAPDRKWTAASHQLSFDRDLSLTRTGDRSYACSGAPADCVVAAMTILFSDGAKPELVLAGINDKCNVAEDLAYSGTVAIAREATFWAVPAISLSRAESASATEGAADLDALSGLLRVLWNRRGDWAADGHWLSLNLPPSLPAPLVQARTGRDKIAAAADILDATPEGIRYRIRRGRPGTVTLGDENACLAGGKISVVRYCWFTEARLPEPVVGAWSSALE